VKKQSKFLQQHHFSDDVFTSTTTTENHNANHNGPIKSQCAKSSPTIHFSCSRSVSLRCHNRGKKLSS